MTLVLFPAPLSFHYRALGTGFRTSAKKKNYYFFTHLTKGISNHKREPKMPLNS